MTEKSKIGIEMYYPYELIIQSIIEFLATEKINKEELFIKMHSIFNGENRARKATNSLYAVITNKTNLQKAIQKNFTAEAFSKLSKKDQEFICLSMICLKYPFLLDVMSHFAKVFNTQETVSIKYIKSIMASTYGSNRTMEIALIAAVYFLLNANIIERVKPGLFRKCKPASVSNFTKEAWISVFLEYNKTKTFSLDDLQYEPLMTFLCDFDLDWENAKILQIEELNIKNIII